MVWLLSMDTTTGTILFRRQLPQLMLLIDHILRSNLFMLQHIVNKREAISEALYRISKGYWFNLAELIMMTLFHFEDRVHRQRLPRVESTPLLFPRLLCQVLEHIGFPESPDRSVVTAMRPPLLSIGGRPCLAPFIFCLWDETRTNRLLIFHSRTCPL